MTRPKVKLRGLSRLSHELRAIGVRRFAIEVDFDEPEERKRAIGFAADASESLGGFGIETDDETEEDE